MYRCHEFTLPYVNKYQHIQIAVCNQVNGICPRLELINSLKWMIQIPLIILIVRSVRSGFDVPTKLDIQRPSISSGSP